MEEKLSCKDSICFPNNASTMPSMPDRLPKFLGSWSNWQQNFKEYNLQAKKNKNKFNKKSKLGLTCSLPMMEEAFWNCEIKRTWSSSQRSISSLNFLNLCWYFFTMASIDWNLDCHNTAVTEKKAEESSRRR